MCIRDRPEACLEVIPSAGHNPLLDAFESTALVIQEFLKRI